MVDKYKAWLVAHRFTQIHGVDYFDTYLPVMDDHNCTCTHSVKAKPDRSEKVRNCRCRLHEHDVETSHT